VGQRTLPFSKRTRQAASCGTVPERFSELEQRKLVVDQLDREIANLKGVYELSSQNSNEVLINSVMDNASVTSVRVIEKKTAMIPWCRYSRGKPVSLLFPDFRLFGRGGIRVFQKRHFDEYVHGSPTSRRLPASPWSPRCPIFSPSMNGNLFASSRNSIPVVNIDRRGPVPCVAFFIAPVNGSRDQLYSHLVTALVASWAQTSASH